MLILLVSIIPLFLHLFGFHCNSDKQVITTSTINFVTNFQLAFQNPKEIFNSSKYIPYKYMGIEDCSYLVREVSTGLYSICSNNSVDCDYVLRATPKIFSNEPACVYSINQSYIYINDGLTPIQNLFIFSNAYRKPDDELGWFADCDNECVPPPHYYWNHVDNTYTCQDLEFCGLNNTRITYTIDMMLANAGGTRLYSSTQNDRDYKAAVRIACTSEIKPNISVFSIPVFDFKLWIAMMVVGLLFFFLSKIRNF